MATTPAHPADPRRGARPAPATTLVLKPGMSWQDAWQRSLAAAPEAFRDDQALNLWGAAWHPDGHPLPATSPVDGSPVAGLPRLDADTALHAVRASSISTGPGARSCWPNARPGSPPPSTR